MECVGGRMLPEGTDCWAGCVELEDAKMQVSGAAAAGDLRGRDNARLDQGRRNEANRQETADLMR